MRIYLGVYSERKEKNFEECKFWPITSITGCCCYFFFFLSQQFQNFWGKCLLIIHTYLHDDSFSSNESSQRIWNIVDSGDKALNVYSVYYQVYRPFQSSRLSHLWVLVLKCTIHFFLISLNSWKADFKGNSTYKEHSLTATHQFDIHAMNKCEIQNRIEFSS